MYANSHWRSRLGALSAFVTGGDFKKVGRRETIYLCEFALAQFAARMEAVQAFMNSPGFAREGGGRGLAGLARELRSRCELVISRKGERIPK